jgi:hypothetical protein
VGRYKNWPGDPIFLKEIISLSGARHGTRDTHGKSMNLEVIIFGAEKKSVNIYGIYMFMYVQSVAPPSSLRQKSKYYIGLPDMNLSN